MLMLIGLSAKNAILYLDFVVERIGKMPLNDALVDAARLRFRPIVMTTLTILVTSFPLIFGTGQGSEFGKGLGTVMFGGILSSAVLTFFVVPAAFFLFERKRVAPHRSRNPWPGELTSAAWKRLNRRTRKPRDSFSREVSVIRPEGVGETAEGKEELRVAAQGLRKFEAEEDAVLYEAAVNGRLPFRADAFGLVRGIESFNQIFNVHTY